MKSIIDFIFICLLASCAPNMYIPNMQNIPGFKEKGEIVLNGSVSDLGNEFQVAYSVSDKVGILLNGCYYKDEFNNGQLSNVPGLGRAIEIGGGFYKKRGNFIFENYSLLGFGSLKNEQGYFGKEKWYPYGNLSSKFYRIANQTSLTYSRKNFEASFSNRLSLLHYYNTSKSPYIFNDVDMSQYLRSSPNFFFLEPAATFRLGLKNVKLQLQLQRSFSVKKIPSTNHYQYFEGIGFIGVFIKI